jgi:hypothetical protein
MDDEIKKKEAFLESKGFKYLSSREVWISKAGEISREFVEDRSLEELERKLSKAEKTAEFTKKPFKLYNF